MIIKELIKYLKTKPQDFETALNYDDIDKYIFDKY